MIFATVGTQLPFDRLIDALDALAAALEEPVIAQTGPAGADAAGAARWPRLDCRPSLAPAEFDALFAAARLVVAHAGVGTLLSARRHGKPLVVLPRRHALGEHRNDHQLATARQVAALPGVTVAWDTDALPGLLRGPTPPPPGAMEAGAAHAALIARLRAFVDA